MNEGWETNCTLDELCAWVRSCRHIAVLTHTKPDGDALGSALGAVRAIRMATDGRTKAEAWFVDPMPPYYNELAEPDESYVLRESDIPEREHDGVLIVDTGSWVQIEPVADWVRERREIATVVDHHRQGDGDIAARRYVDTTAAAASLLVGELACRLFGVGDGSGLPTRVGEPLIIGLASDTGWFRHSNTDARAMRFGAELLESGVDHARMFEMCMQRDRPGRLHLKGRALSSLEFLDGGRLALMMVTEEDFKAAGATQGDSGGFSDIPLCVGSVQVGVVITETSDAQGPIAKVSIRSKAGPGAVDVNEAARRLGGGGHARAAGAKMRCSMAEARERVLEALT